MKNGQKPDKVSLFIENAEKAASITHLIGENEKPAGRIMELLPKGAVVYCPRATKLEKAASGRIAGHTDDFGLATVTIREVSAAIAETGSLVCDSGDGRAVQATLLPEHHIAIVPREKIFATFEEYFATVSSPPPTNITFITGPSRTTDIELEEIIGVHGPARLDIIIV